MIEDYRHDLNKKLEEYKLTLSQQAEQRKLLHERFMSIWRALFEYAQIAIRTVIFINGAAVTAILALLSVVEKSGKFSSLDRIALGLAIGAFAVGVSGGFAATIFAYLSQYQLAQHVLGHGIKEIPMGIRWERTAGLVSVVFGYIFFW